MILILRFFVGWAPDPTTKRPDYTGELEHHMGNVINCNKISHHENQARIKNNAAALLHITRPHPERGKYS